MKHFMLLLLLINTAVAKNCNLKIVHFDINQSVKLIIQSSKKCKGYGVKLFLKNNSVYSFYVNFTPKITKEAPPFGFSFQLKGEKYHSLGVDKNIIGIKSKVKLLKDSSIKNDKNGFRVYWHISLDNINTLKEISFDNIKLKHTSPKECKRVYLTYLTKPREQNITVKSGKFINFCKSSWSIQDSNSLLNEIFHLTPSNKKNLKKRKNRDILEFISNKHSKNVNQKSCKIYVNLINSHNLQAINSKDFIFLVEKINKEFYKRKFKNSSFEILRGVYGIKAISNRYSGTSQIINCDGGDYYVTIPVFAHI